jgi:hypothetical protein
MRLGMGVWTGATQGGGVIGRFSHTLRTYYIYREKKGEGLWERREGGHVEDVSGITKTVMFYF